MIAIKIKELINQVDYHDSIDGNFSNFIKFAEEILGIKLKIYQIALMRLMWKPRKKHYLLCTEEAKEQNTIEFKNGSKLTIIPNPGENVRSKRGEEYLKKLSKEEIN